MQQDTTDTPTRRHPRPPATLPLAAETDLERASGRWLARQAPGVPISAQDLVLLAATLRLEERRARGAAA